MKKILLYMENKYPNIPTNDKDAYQTFYDNNDVYNKLYLSQLQGLDAAPVGITPIEFPVIIKPIINLYGMSNGFKKIDSIDNYQIKKEYGMFWQKYLDGIQYNFDINMKDGKIIQYFCVISEPGENGMFKYHYYEKNYTLSKKNYEFIEKILYNYSGFVNIEIINDFIIEMHLRLNGDLFLYSEENIDDMVNYKEIQVNNICFFPIFVNKYLNIDIEKFINGLNIDYEMDDLICNNHKRLLYFRHHDLEEGIKIQNIIYNNINNYNFDYNNKYYNFFC